jgi:6-pyruvoyltetrahydropterin/6-carboxytetrahydropterin synthase
MMISATRYHDLSFGHRVTGHESKCAHLHGHNYRIHFTVIGEAGQPLDPVGRVVDFGTINSLLCAWIEEHWDHRFLAWEKDPVMLAIERALGQLVRTDSSHRDSLNCFGGSIVWTPFNPTAENLAIHLLEVIGPALLGNYNLTLVKVKVEETRKCSAEVEA